MSRKIQIVADVIPGSIWHGSKFEKFIVKNIVADAGQLWVHYEEMGSKRAYHCLVEAFQTRFTPFVNHNYRG